MNIVKHIGFLPGCKLFCALLFLISFRPLQLSGQPTRLDFNGNLKDVSGQFDGVSNSNLSYVTESDKTAVSLSGPEHVRFPIALSKSLKSERLRFRIRFKVLPDSQGNIEEGRIFLFGNARHQRRFPGFRLDLHSDGENLFLVNTAGDVLAFQHEGEDRQGKLGKVLPNKWYEIVATLEMGREAPYIEYIFDGWQQFHELLVGEGFDLSSFRTHLSAGSPLQIGGVGYYPLGASVEAEEATDTGATLLVDNFVVEPTIVSVDSKRIKETFINLSSHLNGSAPLTMDQLEAVKHSLYLELDLTTAKEAFSEIKSFLQVYESMSFSLFHNGTRVQLDDLDMMAQIVFHVKQWMLDSLYVGGDLQLLEGVAFEEASVWPGVPKANAPRTTSTNPASLTISGTYNSTPGIQSNGSAHAYRMTGCYAAPGEIVTLTFPNEALNQDLRVMVGVHFWNTYYVRPYNRLNRISLSYPVTNSTVQVVNPMGGSILIRVPDGSNIGDLTVTVENSVYTPYFSTKAGAETTSQEWAKAKFESNVPWVEFESDKVQLSAPRSLFDAGTLNPQQILAEWDSILDAFSIVGGRSLDRARPYFFLADRQPVANGTAAPAANPLPLIPGNNTGSWENFLDPRPNSNSNGVSAEYIVLHEMGHAHNYPTLGNQEQESNVNLPAVAAYNLTYGFDLTTDAMAQSIDQGLSLDEAAIDWMISPNFSAKAALSQFGQDNGNGARLLGMSMDYEEWDRAWNEEQTEMGYVWNEIRYQSRGHAKFVELANLYGWESVGNAHAAFMQLGAKDNRVINYGVADDDFIRKASYANNKNLAPLFHFWGITPSAELVQELNYLPKATEFKARLKHYRSIIPGNNTAFRAHFTTLQTGAWTKGYWSDQANGFQVFRYKGLEKVYDETRAKLMSDQIDYLISVYFSEEGSVNQPPVIVSGPASQIFDINTPVSIPMTVTDSDTEQKHLRYSFKFSNPSREYFPEGLFLNSHTGELYGQMDNPSIWGPFKIGVFDGLTEVFSDPFDIGFTDPSGEPILMFTNIIDLEIASGETLTHSFNIEGSTEGFYDFKIRSLFEPHVDFSPSWIQKDSFGITLSPSDINIGEYSDLFVIINTAHIIDKAGLFSIRVVPGDDSLHLVGTPVNKLMATRPYDFTPSLLRGSQVQGSVNFSASNLPGWLRLDTSTGRIFGTPQANDGGTYSGITITVSSSSKSATLGPFSIEVSYDGKLKVLNLKSAYILSPGQEFVVPIVLEDLDAEDSIYMSDAYTNLRFSNSKPEWMHYDGGSRPAKLYGTVPEGVGGSYSLEFNIHSGKPFYSLPVTVLGDIDNTPPDAPTITGFTQTSDVTLTLTGEAEAGSSVVIYNGNTSLGTVIADSEGRFNSTLNPALSAGSYSITAKTTVSGGNISQSSDSFNLVVFTDMTTPILTYVIEGNSVTITDYDENASGALVIPSSYQGKPVTKIGYEAFRGCSSLTSVTIPDSVTTIGRGAFRDCSSLTSILIPSSVTLIGHDNHAPAFRGCDSLTDIEVDTSNAQYNSEDGVLFSKDGTTLIKFPGGKSGHYTIPDSVTSIEQAAFAYASKMTSVTIPNSVTSIGQYAFWAAKGLTRVTIPESITSLEPRVFYDSNIESIVIPESVTSIGFGAFSHCGSLTSVTIPNEDTVIDASAFEASVTIFLGKAATIDSQERVTSTAVGETLVLAMVTSGKNVTYQWSKDGTDIAGATSATLELSGVTGSDAGSYVLKVTNGGGSVESSPIVVSVQTSDPGEGDGTGKGEQENAVPVLAGMSDVELESGGSKSVSVSFSDSDQGDNHTVTVSSDNSKVSVSGIGNTSGSEYTLSAADGYEGTLTVTVVVSDGTDSDTGTFQVSVSGTSGGETVADESFGEPVTYTNIATTLIGQVTINGTAAREGDVVAFYVGDELRGKQAVVVYAGTAWVNAQVHAAGGEETVTFKVYEASTGITYDKVGLSVEIKPEGEAGAFAEPLLVKMDNVAPELTLLGEVQVTIDQRTTYADAGASATDNVDGDLTSKIVVAGAVNTSTAGIYTLKYDVSDAAGNAAESVSRTVVVEQTTVLQTVNLKAGWNLISFYVESEDMAPATVLSSIKGNLSQIKDLKSSYNPSLPPFLNTLKGLNVKDGYWVSVDADVSFDLEGEAPAGASITVKPGWNLVGYPRENGAAPANELTSLGGIVEQFKNLKSSYDPTLPPFLNTLKVIAPGLGYWLKVSAGGEWNVGDVSGGGSNRDISKMGQDESRWGTVVVYPNVSATVLAQVTVEGKAVSSGSVVGAFVGYELRGQQEVVLADGKSYVAINVNLTEAESVRYRIWDATSDKEYGVTMTMTLEMGESYGTAEKLVELDGVVPPERPILKSVSITPFSFRFESQVGFNYVVEATDNSKKWGALKVYNGTGTMIRFEDERDQVFQQIYYRVKVVE